MVYFLLKTKIKPNTVTIVYSLLGLIGGILLAVPMKVTILIAIIIFFSRGFIDWGDGFYARLIGQTSVTGHILDCYGGFLGVLSLQVGLGFYVAQKSEMVLFYLLIPLIPFFYAVRLHTFASLELFNNYITSEKIGDRGNTNVPVADSGPDKKIAEAVVEKYSLIQSFAKGFLDGRARTVDFICFLILLEMFTPIFVTWIIFLGFVIKQFLIFSASFYIVARGGWAEKRLQNKGKEMSRVFSSDS